MQENRRSVGVLTRVCATYTRGAGFLGQGVPGRRADCRPWCARRSNWWYYSASCVDGADELDPSRSSVLPSSIARGRAAVGAELHRGKGVAGAELPHRS
jgi:hypothetical protein